MLIGYHLVKTAYGRWLPGDGRGLWSAVWDERIGQVAGGGLQQGDTGLERFARSRMRYSPVTFTREMMAAIELSVKTCEAVSDWSIAAMALEPTHLHLLLTGLPGDPNATCKWIAQQTAKAVHAQTDHNGPVWAKGKWCARVEDEEHWRNAIAYVNRHLNAKATDGILASIQQETQRRTADTIRGFGGITIISGGQTGVDRAALDFALAAGIAHGGWAPRGRAAEDGAIDPRYALRETPSPGYAQRTEWNIRDSDATLVFSRAAATTGGTRLTIDLARRLEKPWLHLVEGADKPIAAHAAAVRGWLDVHRVATLNIAGPRASQAPGIGRFVDNVLAAALLDPNRGRRSRVLHESDQLDD